MRLVLRLLKYTALATVISVVGVVLLIAIALYVTGDYTDTETARFKNPNGTIEAVTILRQGNVTVPDAVRVYLVPSGHKRSGDPVLIAIDVSGLLLAWRDDTTLYVHTDQGDPYQPVGVPTVKVSGHAITVKIERDFGPPLRP